MPIATELSLLVALLLLACIAVLSLLPRRTLRARAWALFRCFWPSWRFFDVPSALPSLRVRFAAADQDYGQWLTVLTAPTRRSHALLLNAAFNLELAYAAAVETLAAELEASQSEPNEVSYEIVRRIVEQRVAELSPRAERYQFALFEPEENEPWFSSEEHSAVPR